jgi:TonB family protein
MPVNNSIAVNVAMEQDVAQLSEVVVTGFGEKEAPAFSTFEMAEPRGGRRAFKKYLEDKLIYPQQALANNVEGKVTIQFTVETTGQLSNFNIIKGIGYGCDEEVIRLIKQGPKWSATKRNDEPVKGRVRVRLRFTLPKKK